MFIKTVSTTSGINPIKFDETGGVFYWILNTGLSTVYASTKATFTAGDDGVVSLGPKESRRLETNNDTIYILGEGQVEIHNQRDGICSFKQAPTSSGGGGTVDAYTKTESDDKYAQKTDVAPYKMGMDFGTCTTAAETVVKSVTTLHKVAPALGAVFAVKFNNAVPAQARLNINGLLGYMQYRGSSIPNGVINAGDIATFIYYSSSEFNTFEILSVENGGNAKTVNGFTVGCNVPADAVFTPPDLSGYASKALYGDTTINVGRTAGTDVGEYSTAEGYDTTASGDFSHAEGANTTASGDFSHAEGLNTIAIGESSHAEGGGTVAFGKSSHAEGRNTTASGDFSHAEGLNTIAIGESSHAGGNHATASGNRSFSHGNYTNATHDDEIAFGKFNQSNDDTLFSVGDGTADDARHNAFEITTTGGKLHDKDIAVDVANPNLLINPDFKINQRAVSGTFSDTGKYFVDRWKLDSGTVTVHTNGTLTLNGTMSQILENAAGTDVTASVSAGAAAYDDSTKTFTITGDGAVISWVKLERGGIATAFVPPDPAMEQMKCYRFFYRVGGKGIANPNDLSNSNRIAYHTGANFWVSAIFQFPVEMRVVPTAKITGTPWCFKELYSTKSDVAGEFNMDLGIGVIITAETSGYEIRMITDYLITLKTPDGYVGPSNSTGYTDFDAEIY